MHIHLLGCIEFDRCLTLQERLVYEAGNPSSSPISVLICEHPATISLGRCGSRAHVHLSDRELESRRIQMQWLGRGGGAVLHGPGQLSIYPIVSLERCGWSVGRYLQLLIAGVEQACRLMNIQVQTRGGYTIWGRTGAIATAGVAVRYGVTMQGVWLNLNPDMYLMKRIDSLAYLGLDSGSRPCLSSVLSETGRPAKMSRLRSAVVEGLSQSFSAEEYQLHTGHSFLPTDSAAT